MIYEPEDRKICEELLHSALKRKQAMMHISDLILTVGRYFLNTPYVDATLETTFPAHETLVINLRQMDCFTFVENTIVFARLIKSGESTFGEFAEALKKVRYRGGILNGYASRLHYFSDWLHDNQIKGFVRDITAEVGGTSFTKKLNFMTNNPDRYPSLKKRSDYEKMIAVEKNLSERFLFYIPKNDLGKIADKINNGDLIAVTTDKLGLDVIHAGLAMKSGSRIHLLHASKTTGKVTICQQTLYRYLKKSINRAGVMVGRVMDT